MYNTFNKASTTLMCDMMRRVTRAPRRLMVALKPCQATIMRVPMACQLSMPAVTLRWWRGKVSECQH
jgi:hypothetical protein